jgi:aryl-alcohol dehydrogenase-like predicted oxidoreductase
MQGMTLDRYQLLGRSGLRVSPLSLGTMTFGLEWGWGADRDEAARIFSAYIERGGNFIDTANQYTNGTAEKMIGAFAAGRRDRLVIATKFTLPMDDTDPNSGGNSRKSMVRSVEGSLRRLATDYIDLLYLHAWDQTTPVEEVLRAMDDLVRAGKVLYFGISNTPAWQISRMQAIAESRGWPPLIALQVRYNLIDREVERDLLPMAREMGLGVIPWSPLAEGLLAGKYSEADLGPNSNVNSSSSLRRAGLMESGAVSKKAIAVAGVVKKVAQEADRTAAQVALAWTLAKAGVVAPIIGARTLAQFEENLGALDVELSQVQRDVLERAGSIELGYPHDYLGSLMASGYMGVAMHLRSGPS